MKRIQFGLVMPADSHNRERRSNFVPNLNRALELVAGHFDSAWMVDHLQFDDADILEGFTTLSYFASLHAQLKFGNTVLCQSFRNPALLAKMGATLQFLSGGRFILGIGAGWQEEEYRAYGYEFSPNAVRVAQLEEALIIIKALWTQMQSTFEGRYYRVTGAYCEPKPDPVPQIMIGATGPKMLRLAARYADGWNVSSTGIQRYRRLAGEFERACAEAGRDPSTVRRSWCGGCVCATTQGEVKRIAGDRYNAQDLEDDFDFVGTPDQLLEQMHPFINSGVDYFMLDCGGFPELTTLESLVNEVLPALNG